MATNAIVTVNVSISAAPAPSTLQQTGAIISQGSTAYTAGTLNLLTQASDLTPNLVAPVTLSTLTWAAGIVTATTLSTLPVNFVTGRTFPVTIAGATPSGYNGSYTATMTGASTFTFALAANPGTETVAGTATITDELVSQVGTFFAQGSQVPVYVLELGLQTPTAAIGALGSFITANPNTVYAYLVPRNWDAIPAFLSLASGYTSTTSKTYFFVTTTLTTYSSYTATMKSVFALVESPVKPPEEFSLAFPFWKALSYIPSGSNRVTPMAFSFGFDVTAYPYFGNSATLVVLKTANINTIQTGAEGGLSNTILKWGVTADGNDFSYWYSVDWIQINIDLNIANAIINGSNNPINPLYYNQDGINRLQDISVATIQTAISDGMATGTATRATLNPTTFAQQISAGAYNDQDVVNAVPFITYLTLNPSDYQKGNYAGLSALYIPARGFTSIIFNINVTNFIVQ